MKFLCTTVDLEVATTRSVLTSGSPLGERLRIPINHFEGNYVCSPETLRTLREEDRIVLRYVDNPNGSMDSIAAVCSDGGNVVGLMPHPERACEQVLGSEDGAVLLRSFLGSRSVSSIG